jgi:purine-binding chemotaxis protein CheW
MEAQQFCTFLLSGYLFGVPVPRVQEVIRFQPMTPVPLAPPAVRGMINLRGQIVLAIDLRLRLSLAERPEGELPMNVVVRTPDGAVSLLVDQIGDVIDVQPSTFEPPPETLRGPLLQVILGVHKLSDSLLHVLDAEKACQVHDKLDAS